MIKVYRNYGNISKINQLNSKSFWLSLYLATGLWLFLLLKNILTFSVFDMIISLFPSILLLNNLVNYTKCISEGHSLVDKLKEDI